MPFYLKFPQNSINSRIGVVHKKTGSENTLPGICLLEWLGHLQIQIYISWPLQEILDMFMEIEIVKKWDNKTPLKYKHFWRFVPHFFQFWQHLLLFNLLSR